MWYAEKGESERDPLHIRGLSIQRYSHFNSIVKDRPNMTADFILLCRAKQLYGIGVEYNWIGLGACSARYRLYKLHPVQVCLWGRGRGLSTSKGAKNRRKKIEDNRTLNGDGTEMERLEHVST